MNNTQTVLLELVKAGLWGNENPDIRIDGDTDWQKVYQLATEQSVLGLVLAGLEHSEVKPPQVLLLQWIGEVQQLEQRNKAMNEFVAELIDRLKKEDVCCLLVKGQGVAQCYEKPLCRCCGDVDLLLTKDDFRRAISILFPIADESKYSGRYSKEFVVRIHPWSIELHGTLRTGLSTSLDKSIDDVQSGVFFGGNMRSWDNNGTLVFLPAPTEDVFFVFTHFIKHFYKEGMSLRQLCDWCRLLWTYRAEISIDWLGQYLCRAGLMKEWQAFGALAVEYLGMPAEAMPFINLNDNVDLNKKAEKLMEFILGGYSGNKVKDTLRIAKIFPRNALRYSPNIFLNVNWLKIKERLIK